MIHVSRLRRVILFCMLLGPFGVFASEHALVVSDVARLGGEQNQMLQDHVARVVSEGVERGIQEGVRKGAEESAIKDNSIPWGTVAKAGCVVTLVGGGSFVLFKWLRKQWATPKDLDEKDKRVSGHMQTKREGLQSHVDETLQPVEDDVAEVGSDAHQLAVDVGSIAGDVRTIFSRNSGLTGTLLLGLGSGASRYTLLTSGFHRTVMGNIGLAGILLNSQLANLSGIRRVGSGVQQLRLDMSSHSERMSAALKLQRELQRQEHGELLSDVEGLAKSVPGVQVLIQANGRDLQQILKGIQALRKADEEQDERLEAFATKHDELLGVLSKQGEEQRLALSHIEGMHHQLDGLIGALLVMPGSDGTTRTVGYKRRRVINGSQFPVLQVCTCGGGTSCSCLN